MGNHLDIKLHEIFVKIFQLLAHVSVLHSGLNIHSTVEKVAPTRGVCIQRYAFTKTSNFNGPVNRH